MTDLKRITLQDVREFFNERLPECDDCPFLRTWNEWDDGRPQQVCECSILEDGDTDPANCPGVS